MRRKISFVAAGMFALLGLFLILGQVLSITGNAIGTVGDYHYGILIAEGLFVVSILLFQFNKKK